MNLTKLKPKYGKIISLQLKRFTTVCLRIWKITLVFLKNPKLIPAAIKANYKAWISKEYSKQTENKTKYDYIKSTAEILSKCPNNCQYQMECCGCSIYAAVEKNKQCKYTNETNT